MTEQLEAPSIAMTETELLHAPDPLVDLSVPPPSGGGRVLFAGIAYNGYDPVETLLPEGWTGERLQDHEFCSGRISYKVWFHTARRIPRLVQRRYEAWLLRGVGSFKPHLVIVKRGTFFSPRLIEALHDQGVCVFNVNNDAWDSATTWNTHPLMFQAIPHYDAMFPTKARNVCWLRDRGGRSVAYMRLWYSPNMFYRESISAEELQQWQSDVCFVGSYEAPRLASLDSLARRLPSAKLRVYGNMWKKAALRRDSPLRDCITYRDAIQGNARRALIGARIGLGFLRESNGDTHTSRTFEIPATGTCMLMEYSEEQAALFPEGEAWVAFRNADELLEKTQWLLADDERRVRIAACGHKMTTEGPHSLRHRLARMLWVYRVSCGFPLREAHIVA